VGGNVSSSSGTINFGGANKVASCVSSRSSSTITLGYGASAGGVCCGSTCSNSCVANNSGAAVPPSCSLITYVGSTDLGSAVQSSSITLTAPAGITTGDVMIAAISQVGVVTFKPPAGWTLVEASSGKASQSLSAWTRTATAADKSGTAYVFGSTSSADIFGGVQAWRGVNGTAPVATSAIQANSTGMSSAAPSVTPSVNNSVLVAMWGDGDASIAMPFGMTATVGSPSGTKKGNTSLLSAYEFRINANATGTRTASLSDSVASNGLSLALQPAVLLSLDHYEMSLPSNSINCLPSTVTVTACTNSSSPCTNPSTSLSGATATLSTNGASLGSSTITFDNKGIATTTLSFPSASQGAVASVSLSGESTAATSSRQCCPDGVKCAVANSCSTTFNTAGFIISSSTSGSAATLPTQTAGTASGSYYLRAVQTNTSTGACTSALTGSNTVNWAYQCNNPTTCSAGNLMAINGGTATAVSANPNSGVSSYSAVTMTFDAGGNAPFSFTYGDVGQVTLYVSKSASGSLLSNLSGSSNAFVVKPVNLVISNIKQTALPNLVNPAAANASGAKFVAAGEAFTATVTAQTSGGVATPNFGRETPAEGVLLTPTLVLPSGGTTGALSNGSIAGGSFSNGAATVSTLAYSEVGIVTLNASLADASYLGAGNVTGTASANVGRFIPAKFVLSNPSVTHRSGRACSPVSTFTHLDENFSLGFTLTAQNVTGGTTANYVGSFAKLDPTAANGWNVAGLGGTTSFSTASGRLSLGTATGSWANGVASGVSVIASATRATTPDGPFNTTFGIAPTDSDGVAMSAFDMASTSGGSNDRTTIASVALRFGRLRLSSAVGPADRTLPLPVTAQYWSGSTWDTNTLDSCTTVTTSAFNFGNLMRTITTADTAASGAITLAAGTGLLKLASPSSGHLGTYDVALSLGSTATDASCLQTWAPGTGDAATAGANLAYLRGAWCGSSYAKDPSARATFGQQSTQQNLIYRRENY
jgi:MSHA biogenesis protein MshQ